MSDESTGEDKNVGTYGWLAVHKQDAAGQAVDWLARE